MTFIQLFHAVGDYFTDDTTNHSTILFIVCGVVLALVFLGIAKSGNASRVRNQSGALEKSLSSRLNWRLFTSGLGAFFVAGFIFYISYTQPEILPFSRFMGVAFAGVVFGILLCGYALYSMTKE